jgi:hypothetical protein
MRTSRLRAFCVCLNTYATKAAHLWPSKNIASEKNIANTRGPSTTILLYALALDRHLEAMGPSMPSPGLLLL